MRLTIVYKISKYESIRRIEKGASMISNINDVRDDSSIQCVSGHCSHCSIITRNLHSYIRECSPHLHHFHHQLHLHHHKQHNHHSNWKPDKVNIYWRIVFYVSDFFYQKGGVRVWSCGACDLLKFNRWRGKIDYHRWYWRGRKSTRGASPTELSYIYEPSAKNW